MRFLLALLSILIMVVIFFVFVFLGRIIEPLLALLPQTVGDILLIIVFIVFFIGMNINWYYTAYVKRTSKRRYFWALFITTIAFALLILWVFVIGF